MTDVDPSRTTDRSGSLGLMVSAVGIGCNAFGARIDAEQTHRGVVDAAIDARRHAVRHRRRLRRRAGLSRDVARRGLGAAARRRRDRHQVRLGHARRQRAGLGCPGLAPLRPPRGRDAACVGSAPTGSTSTSCTRPTRSRRSTRRWPRSHELVDRGQGPLHRLVELRRMAGRRRRLDGPTPPGSPPSSPRRTSTRSTTGPPTPSWSRPASTSASDLLPYFPLEYGLLTGKYRRGQAAPAGSRLAAPSQASASRAPTSTGSRRSPRTPTTAGSAARRGDRAGSRPALRRVGHRRRHQCRPGQGQRRRPAAGDPTDDDLDALDELTAWDRQG